MNTDGVELDQFIQGMYGRSTAPFLIFLYSHTLSWPCVPLIWNACGAPLLPAATSAPAPAPARATSAADSRSTAIGGDRTPSVLAMLETDDVDRGRLFWLSTPGLPLRFLPLPDSGDGVTRFDPRVAGVVGVVILFVVVRAAAGDQSRK